MNVDLGPSKSLPNNANNQSYLYFLIVKSMVTINVKSFFQVKLFNHKKYGFTHFKLLSSQIAPIYRPSQRARKLATRGSHICKYLYRRNGKEMFTLIQKERIMHLFTTSQTIFPSDMTSRVRQDISHKCILHMHVQQ